MDALAIQIRVVVGDVHVAGRVTPTAANSASDAIMSTEWRIRPVRPLGSCLCAAMANDGSSTGG
jgi:hypothetical protein